jgi:hypothetical protein
MSDKTFEMIFKAPLSPGEGRYVGSIPPLNSRTVRADGMIIDYDVAVRMRDGVRIYVDIYRPDREGKYPALVCWTPYGKFRSNYDFITEPNVRLHEFNVSKYATFEGLDPIYWCRNDYVIINADSRGAWNSEGDLTYYSEEEAQDCYDLIEWASTQYWSSGKVAMGGVSYLAWTQWKVAAISPPHLVAINPWEGVSDFYREWTFHGGIPINRLARTTSGYSRTRIEDVLEMRKRHPLFDDYWASKNPDLSKIVVPAFVVASWSDQCMHTRGTLEGFKRITSKDKWLIVHGRKKWWYFYQEENVEKQRQFFDMFLKGIDNHVKDWPKVTLEIREKFYVGNTRTENEWPLARTQYTKLFLNAREGTLNESPIEKETQVGYSVDNMWDKTQNAKFEFKFDKRTELTGHMKLKLWAEAYGSDDMDLFVAIQKTDRAGYLVGFPFDQKHDDGPVTLGWLRASHRELDEKRSTPYQPYHKHEREIKLKVSEIFPMEIEIIPSSTLFERGEKLRLVVQGSDIYYPPGMSGCSHTELVNKGKHVIHAGGEYDSHLLVPVIPCGD